MNKSCIIIILGLVLVLISMSGTVSAVNITVNPGGSIQSAVNHASSQDTVIVKDNGSDYTYRENVVVNKRLTFKTSGHVVIQALNSSEPVFRINSGGSGSTIQGFNVRGATNSYGVYLNSVNNFNLVNNNIHDNKVGVYICNSSAMINYNRIIGNSVYGLYKTGTGTVNAQNNWWGKNNPVVSSKTGSDICGAFSYNPWLVFKVNPISYVISNGKCAGSTITADITHNSKGNDTSSLGYVLDGLLVNFKSNLGKITGQNYTKNGKTNSYLNLSSVGSGEAVISASVDKQVVSTFVNKVPIVTVNISSSAADLYRLQPLNLTCKFSLSNPVTWLSIIYREIDEAESVKVLVNGKTILTGAFFNNGNSYTSNVKTTLTYPVGSLTKTEKITYMNGADAGFETIQSFAIATSKITDNTIKAWLHNKSKYPAGSMKAAYGTFMTALTTLYLSDKLAAEMAPKLKVNWNRTKITLAMSGVSSGIGCVHCPDPAMGMSVVGSVESTKSFRFVCSLLLSEIEHSTVGATGLSVNSTVAKIISGIFKGKKFDMIRNGKIVTIMLDGDPNSKIVIDTSTGLVWDLTISNGFQYKGAVSQNAAYCYHDQLTDNIANQLSKLIPALENRAKSVLSALGGAINGTQKFIVKNWNHIADIGFTSFELGFGIITIPAGSVAGPIGIGLVLKGEGDIFVGIRNWLVPSNYWQYCSYHNPWPHYKTVSRLNNTTHMIGTIEVPIKDDGTEDWDKAIYINAQNGVAT